MLIIKVKNNIDRFIEKNIKNGIAMYEIKQEDNILTCKINNDDLNKVIKLNYYSKIKVIRYLGKKGLLKHIKVYLFDYLMIILFIILLYLLSNFIISVEIKHEDKELEKVVNEIIKKHEIRKFTIKKPMNTLNEISNKIMYQNKDIIDWISINNEGMHYIISVEERIKKEIIQNNNKCHIIATNTGTITKIITNKGINMFEIGSTVHPGEIIVSGEITLNDKIKENVCADAKIFGEVWYKININYPLSYEEKIYTKKSRYNFIFNGNYLYKKNYTKYDEKIIKKVGAFKIIKQEEYKMKKHTYSNEEARSNALELAKKKILHKIGNESRIIEEKVLKETKNNSTIELEIFLSVEQIISKKVTYEVGGKSDTG